MSHKFPGLSVIPDSEGTCQHLPATAIRILTVSFILFLLTGGMAESRELTVKKDAKGYQVEATIDRYPLVLGDNHIEIGIKDGSGKNITGAQVLVNYYMPPMPRMVPMNYKTKADPENEKYEAKMDIIMAGPWYIRIIIKHEGKIATVRFNVDAQ